MTGHSVQREVTSKSSSWGPVMGYEKCMIELSAFKMFLRGNDVTDTQVFETACCHFPYSNSLR